MNLSRTNTFTRSDRAAQETENHAVDLMSLSVGNDDPFAGCDLIGPSRAKDLSAGAPRLSKQFLVDGEIASAILSITALGLYKAEINGVRVGDDVLAPGWTDYRYRLMYSQYDVSKHISTGRNTIDVLLGNGWYRGKLGRPSRRDFYGDRLGLLASLKITLQSGKVIIVTSDESWTASSSFIQSDDLYDGCALDFRHEPQALGVEKIAFDTTILERQNFPGITVTQMRHGNALGTQDDGSLLFDFGQNLVGWVKLSLKNPESGRKIVVRHAETLENGRLALRPLRDAKATDTYYLSGPDDSILAPEFTFHGFRYASIDGVREDEIATIEAVVMGSAMNRTGWFSCSNSLLNKLHENVVWSLRGNFVGIPTDCPQRDERLGWTADIQVFAPTALYLYNCMDLLESWLQDLTLSQCPDGSVPVIVPDIYRRQSVATAGWGDAATIVPWVLYNHSGREEILASQFDTMLRWLERIERSTGPDLIWRGGHQYGDWLDPTAPPDDPAAAMTDRDLVATACFYRSAKIVADCARTLDREVDEKRLRDLSYRIFDRFHATFVTREGRLTSETQAAYAIAISYGLLHGKQMQHAGHRLADLVRKTGFTIATGFLGTPVILDALTATGNEHVAMRLLTQTQCPSWLYPVTMGATTMWERWDSMLPDGTVNPGEMTSFNHYAFGAVADWMHRNLAGLRSESVGWKTFSVTPPTWSGLSQAEAQFDSPSGSISASWHYGDGQLHVRISVPEGTSAVVNLPQESIALRPGTHSLSRILDFANGSSVAHSLLLTRAAIDDEETWDRVEVAIRESRPLWTSKQIATAAFPYLDRPLEELSRCVGLSIPTIEEDRLRIRLRDIATMS